MELICLKENWTAAPDAPCFELTFDGNDAYLKLMLVQLSGEAADTAISTFRFTGCSRWNLDASECHAWYTDLDPNMVQAPVWGGFYEIVGGNEVRHWIDWEVKCSDFPNARHFLLCFRDDTLDFIATGWAFSTDSHQA